MENTNQPTTGLGLLEKVVEKIRVPLVAPLYALIKNQVQSEALNQLNKPRDYEEMLRQLSQ